MTFFTNPEDLLKWVQSQESADDAIGRIIGVIGEDDEQDVADTCRAIFESDQEELMDAENASKVLFDVLAKHKVTTINREADMSKNEKLTKEAQIMRQPGQYDMPLRICPKLPYSVGKRLISTYNCRHYCLDSITFDDDPGRVYCAEALWRRHIMDKFSREFKDKQGRWVGGYFNERWQTFHDDGGNQMELAHGERTRKPRPHQYSTERRLSEGRGEETFDLEAASKRGLVKVASVPHGANGNDDEIFRIFSDIVEMREDGLSGEEIISKTAEHYGMSINSVARVYQLASRQARRYSGTAYACVNGGDRMEKTSGSEKTAKVAFSDVPVGATFMLTEDIPAVSMTSGFKINLRNGTKLVSTANDANTTVMEIVDGPDAGEKVSIGNEVDFVSVFAEVDDDNQRLQDGADEVGLNDEQNQVNPYGAADFPIEEV